MKKFSMGLMLSSMLLIPVGCGEEAPPVATPDPGAMMSHAAGMGAHAADKAGAAMDATADKAGAMIDGAGAAVDATADKVGEAVDATADKVGEAVDSTKEAVKDAAP